MALTVSLIVDGGQWSTGEESEGAGSLYSR